MSTPDSKITWARVQEPDDPRRCQAMTHHGQCLNVALEGARNCAAHGGPSQLHNAEKKSESIYRLSRYKARLDDFRDSDKIKSLRDEIGILRILIEEKMNLCTNELELALAAPMIGDLVVKVEKLVTSCNRIEGQLGELMDKQKAVQMAQEIVEAIALLIEDPDVLEKIADDIINITTRTR